MLYTLAQAQTVAIFIFFIFCFTSLFFRRIDMIAVVACVAFYGQISEYQRPLPLNIDGIAILTGSKARIPAGLALAKKISCRYILISGAGKLLNERHILDRKTSHVFKKSKVHLDIGYAAQNTVGNATEIAEWAGKNKLKNIAIVTSHQHMPRAMLLLNQHRPHEIKYFSYSVIGENFYEKSVKGFYRRARLMVIECFKYYGARAQDFFLNPHTPSTNQQE